MLVPHSPRLRQWHCVNSTVADLRIVVFAARNLLGLCRCWRFGRRPRVCNNISRLVAGHETGKREPLLCARYSWSQAVHSGGGLCLLATGEPLPISRASGYIVPTEGGQSGQACSAEISPLRAARTRKSRFSVFQQGWRGKSTKSQGQDIDSERAEKCERSVSVGFLPQLALGR